jgi:hypothetical protein
MVPGKRTGTVMRYFSYTMKVLLMAAGFAALLTGVFLGEWGRTLLNAALL